MAQSYGNLDLVVIDDCSDDGTCESAVLPAGGDPRAAYRRLARRCGVSRARNTGVDHTNGEWIAFLDSDDVWHPGKLDRQMDWLAGHPGHRIMQTQEVWIRRGKRVNAPRAYHKVGGDIFRESLEHCMITPSSVVMQRSLFNEVGGFNESLPACEDYDLWLRISCRYPVGLLDEPLLTRFGGHDDQLSSTIPVLDRFRIRALLGLLEHGGLTEEQVYPTRSVLSRKAAIVARGCKKRNKVTEYERYRRIAEEFGKALRQSDR